MWRLPSALVVLCARGGARAPAAPSLAGWWSEFLDCDPPHFPKLWQDFRKALERDAIGMAGQLVADHEAGLEGAPHAARFADIIVRPMLDAGEKGGTGNYLSHYGGGFFSILNGDGSRGRMYSDHFAHQSSMWAEGLRGMW